MSSEIKSVEQLEIAIDEVKGEIAAAEAEASASGDPSASAPAAQEDELANGIVGMTMGVAMHVMSEFVGGLAGAGPSASQQENSAFKKDPLTGRNRRSDQSLFVGAVGPAISASRSRDIMQLGKPGETGKGKKPAAGKTGSPKTQKGLELGEAAAIAGDSLTSETRGLKSPKASRLGVSPSSLYAALGGLVHLSVNPNNEMVSNSMHNDARMRQSFFTRTPEQQNQMLHMPQTQQAAFKVQNAPAGPGMSASA